MKLFAREEMLSQHSVLSYRIDLYFPEDKLAIKVDEKGHIDGDEKKEIERQEAIKKELGWEFIRINPDKKDFDTDVEIGKKYNHFIKSTKKSTKNSTKKSLMDKIS